MQHAAVDTDMNSDREQVQAVLAGTPGAFERLVETHQGLCWHIIQRMVRHPEDTRELCQETFLKVYRKLHQYRHDSALKTWIGRVAYNVALRHLQRKRLPMAEPYSNDAPSPLDEVAGSSDLEADCDRDQLDVMLAQAIDQLPPVQRTVLTLYHLQEMSIADIAAVTGLADGTIKSHLFRSRRQLRDLLEDRIGVCP